MMIVKLNVLIAHLVHTVAGKLVTEQRGVTLDIGVEMFFRDEVHRNAFDFGRRTAVQSGKRNRRTHLRRQSAEEGFRHGREQIGMA